MKFKHEIRLIHAHGEAVVATRWFRNSFTRSAYQWFRAEAWNNFAMMHRVKDSTVAGFHFRNADGTVVLELH
jgi:hypothetical protein